MGIVKMQITGARLLAKTLRACGIEYVAGIPGHTIFPFASVVEEEGLKPFLVRSEAIASFAADTYFRVSGKMMAIITHSIPGTSNLAAGMANAYADSSTMLLIAGETARDSLGRGAYQEFSRQLDGDVAGFTRHMTKRTWQTHTPGQLVEHTLRACKIGPLGRPGPVSLHVYQDVWEQAIDVPGFPSADGYLIQGAFRPDAAAVAEAARLIAAADRPLILAGNGVNLSRARAQLLGLAERRQIPVATTVTGKGAMPEDHELAVGITGWVGTAAANWASRNADLVIAVGARMTETATSSWQPGLTFDFGRTKLIQIDCDPQEIANVFPVDVPLIGDARLALQDLVDALEPSTGTDWNSAVAEQTAAWRKLVSEQPAEKGGKLQVAPVVAALRRATLGTPTTIVGDIGKNHKWVAQQFESHSDDYIVSSMGAGTMGIGPCGAIGAALGRPDAHTIAWSGDGGLMMTPFALTTAAEHRLPVKFITIDDGAFGEVANIQEDRYGKTIFSEFNGSGTNPEFSIDVAEIARANGVPAKTVTRADDLEEAMHWMLEVTGPALVRVPVDRRSRVPAGGGQKLSEIWNSPIFPWVGRRPE